VVINVNMDAEQMQAAVNAMDERYRLLAEANDRVIQANAVLQQQNQQEVVNRRELQGRFDGLEEAMRNMGVQPNGAGGFNGNGNAGGYRGNVLFGYGGRGGRGGQGGRGGGQGGGGHAMEVEDWDNDDGRPAAPAADAPRNPRMPNLSFEGKDNDDWMSFRAAFINACNFNRYTDQQAKFALLGCMRGSAFLTVANIDHQYFGNHYVDLLDEYELKFLPPAASDLARTRYETATQGAKESVLEWHGRLRMLHTRAYGNEGNESQLIRAFSHGLRSRKVKENLLRAQPRTYDDALNVAQTEQAVQDSMNFIPGSVPSFATTIAGQKPRRKDGAEPMDIGAIGATGRRLCHTCHADDHLAKDCKLMKKSDVVAAKGAANLGNKTTYPNKKPGAKVPGTKNWDKKPKFGRHVNAVGDVVKEDEDGEEEDEDEEESDDKTNQGDSDEDSPGFGDCAA